MITCGGAPNIKSKSKFHSSFTNKYSKAKPKKKKASNPRAYSIILIKKC
jgi:hypothetical protein